VFFVPREDDGDLAAARAFYERAAIRGTEKRRSSSAKHSIPAIRNTLDCAANAVI
jgi:hypothetical protein